MPRDGSGVYSKPAGTTASPNVVIESAKYNAFCDDLVTDANAARPVTAGGTAATTAVGGADNLSTQGTAIASATTTDIGAATGRYVHITGTTTITGLGTKTAGVVRMLTFDGALILTHNATSLILPGAANIATAAGDTAIMVSEGSGNWRCLHYQRAATVPVRSQLWEHISTTTISSAADWKQADLSAYRRLRVSGYVIGATDGVALSMRTSTNNGSTYDGGASDYTFHRIYGTGTTAAADGSTGATSVNIGLSGGVGNDTGEGCHFTIEAFEFNRAAFGRFIVSTSTFNTTGAYVVGTTGALRVQATARDAMALFFSSGNIASGYVTIEGIRG